MAQNIGYAITNPNQGSDRVNAVTVSVAKDAANGDIESTPGHTDTDVAGCLASWYQVNNSPQTLNKDVAAGSTYIVNAPVQQSVAGNVISIQMLNLPLSQDACQGHTVGLIFSSN